MATTDKQVWRWWKRGDNAKKVMRRAWGRVDWDRLYERVIRKYMLPVSRFR